MGCVFNINTVHKTVEKLKLTLTFICKFDNVQSYSIISIFCVTATDCILYLCNLKNSRKDYNNNQTCNNTRVNKDRIQNVPSSNCNHRLVYV